MNNTNKIKASICGASDTGRQRTNNEDAYIAASIGDGNMLLCAAIDGLGGYNGGEVAAAIARDSITAYVGLQQLSNPLEVIKQAIVKANNDIVAAKAQLPQLQQMGCVATAAIIDLKTRMLYMAHVGDSRLYRFSNGKLVKLSHDHSLVGYREEMGDLTEEQAMHHPMRNLIQRSLGEANREADEPNFIDAGIFPIDASADFLFCSDGLSDMITSAQISSVLGSDAAVDTKAAQLIALANDAGGKDNITVVIASITLPASLESRKVVVDTPISTDVNTDAPTARKTKRRRWLWLLLTIIIGVGAALSILFLAQRSGQNEPQLPGDTVISIDNSLEADSLADSLAAALPDSVALERNHRADSLRQLIATVESDIETLRSRRSDLQLQLDSITGRRRSAAVSQ